MREEVRSKKLSVLFVCLGNICRSPLAEGTFRHLATARGLGDSIDVDSCGTGAWHIGERPHPKTRASAGNLGISLDGITARKIRRSDLERFDIIVAMDRDNLREIKGLGRLSGAELVLLRDYDLERGDPDVPDPYYDEEKGFSEVASIVYRCCERLLDECEKRLKTGP